jgi:hypothetical protein
VLLQWATASEKDNAYFSLEKSRDGQQFNEIGRVARGGYQHRQAHLPVHRRLSPSAAPLLPAQAGGLRRHVHLLADRGRNSQITAALRIYPNPLAANELWVEATDAQADDMRITIHNTVGKLLVDRIYPYEPAVKS